MKSLVRIFLSGLFITTVWNPILCQEKNNEDNTIMNLLDQEVSVDSLETTLEALMKQHQVPGLSVAIINEGKVIYKTVKGYSDIEAKQKVTNKTIFEGASLSKPLFAYLVMKFVEDGKIDLDKPLHEYLPYEDIAGDERYKKITARMVLSHTTGFPNWRTEAPDNKLSIKFEPGTSYEYSGEGYQYLAKVMAHILNCDDEGLEAIYQKQVAQPLQLQYTKYVQDSNNLKNKSKPYDKGNRIKGEEVTGEFGSAYSIHSEAVDFSKWLIALLEEKGLTKESFNALFRAQVQLPEDAEERAQGVTNWTLGFAKVTLPMGTLYAHGGNNWGYTSLFAINREKKWGYVMFTNANQSMLPLQFLMYLNGMK
ncbi:serine hydrolase domain-containing protein [Xanthovirga aplysinae]|uniref:serine hydrolase domain-containing protein n=1 Tax=Xanthovirga aplysinae TaxID=2529853 RepID=UPI001656E689|nr:serine hydrolase domain-containing protein [Xanthovirga aplysinae]